MYHISIQTWSPDRIMKISSDDPNVVLEMTVVNGYEAYLQTTTEGYASLEYFPDDRYVSIIGKLNREEILEIGGGIRLK